jgi:hypothetical protein
MAKRKNKLLLSDLFPELAAEREVAEEEEREREREREEPARKVRKVNAAGADRSGYLSKMEEKWNARLEVCKQWKQAKGRFPKANKKDKEEISLYNWLKQFRLGGPAFTQARWEKLNEAFGEGWEKECFPQLEVGKGFQPGNQHNPRDEAQWDATLEAVKLFKQTHGRFPRRHGGDAEERRLYDWLQKNMDTTSNYYTHERANKLVLAFGDRWQSECFPKSIYAW